MIAWLVAWLKKRRRHLAPPAQGTLEVYLEP